MKMSFLAFDASSVDCSCVERARDCRQALADTVHLVRLDALLVHGFDLRIEIRDMLPHLGEHTVGRCGDGGIICQNSKQRRDIAAAFGRRRCQILPRDHARH